MRLALDAMGGDAAPRVPVASTYGGAPLRGVRGVTINCHGRWPARAIKNAIGADPAGGAVA